MKVLLIWFSPLAGDGKNATLEKKPQNLNLEAFSFQLSRFRFLQKQFVALLGLVTFKHAVSFI